MSVEFEKKLIQLDYLQNVRKILGTFCTDRTGYAIVQIDYVINSITQEMIEIYRAEKRNLNTNKLKG